MTTNFTTAHVHTIEQPVTAGKINFETIRYLYD